MKLLTRDIARKLYQADQRFIETGETPDCVIVKFFAPWSRATWWVVQATPLDSINGQPCEPGDAKDWHMYGFADVVSADCAELGYTLLSELTKITGPYGLKVERDMHYRGNLTEIRGRDQYNHPRNANAVPAEGIISECKYCFNTRMPDHDVCYECFEHPFRPAVPIPKESGLDQTRR